MKQSQNNEIDSMLRGLARRERATSSAEPHDAHAASSMHLDADEMNAYAENALPVATRARYTTHLADCDDCRKVVAQLAIAAGLPAPEREVIGAGAINWKEKLAAVFSPPVLRYLLPALVLVAVVAVGFVALRQRREASFVAQNQPEENSRVAITQNGSKETASTSPQAGTKSAASDESRRSQSQSRSAAANTPKGATAADATAASTPTVSPARDKDTTRNETAAAAQPSYAKEPPPAPKPSDERADAERRAKTAEADRESRDANARSREAESQNSSGAFSKNAPSRQETAGAPASARKAKATPSVAKTTSAGGSGGRADEEAETRVVAGRRFRRENSAWVDTAYDSSQTTINVARGSEQYRALIADEPTIRTFAEQLSGQVIVVWKGHAYRIH